MSVHRASNGLDRVGAHPARGLGRPEYTDRCLTSVPLCVCRGHCVGHEPGDEDRVEAWALAGSLGWSSSYSDWEVGVHLDAPGL